MNLQQVLGAVLLLLHSAIRPLQHSFLSDGEKYPYTPKNMMSKGWIHLHRLDTEVQL